MKLLILVVLVVCISWTESSATKKICQEDSKFLLSVVRVCNLYRRATLARKRNWSSLERYVKYALKVSKQKKQRRSYEDEDFILEDEDLKDLGSFDDENDLDERAAGSSRHQRSTKPKKKTPPPSKDPFRRLRKVCSYLARLLLLR
ncbi:uncharacterized protein LOC124253911 [Haliotis rubra]|uniref:uncharacterized protein LOC124253911 n=1 Tax=Haliotis rubra TaxID=36100 RepID=UPI001EE5E7D5|nr:uncharacterized protein LOC124253911 [Haliotis rubra]XP_046543721.1 uncharacterized protein LOC124253911 [Haliotis rubra]